MTYREWAEEYYQSAADVKKRLETIKKEMKTAAGEKLALLNQRHNILYGMYLDCIHVAETLVKRKGEC